MSTSRRRNRRPDPLASAEAVRLLLGQLRGQTPDMLPREERQLVKMLESVRHYGRRPVVKEGRGRPRRWPRESVAVVARKLEKLLRRETAGRVSVSSFVSLYLPMLRYPADIGGALGGGEINIREAAYLARLTPGRLNCTPRQARQLREQIKAAHVLTGGSQSSLRLRVKAVLGEIPIDEPKPVKSGRQKSDELIKRDPYDARHLFYEEILRLEDAMREIEPGDLSEQALANFLRQTSKLRTWPHTSFCARALCAGAAG
jgi:hypothetical protein